MAAAPKYKSIERYLLAGLRELNLQWLELLGAHAENAPLCAEICRANGDCRAMTYVISQKSCWLKAGVPPPLPPGGPDYISSVKK